MKRFNVLYHGLSLLVVAIMILLAFGSSDDSSSSSSSSSSSHLVVSNKQYRVKEGALGFRSKENFEKYLQFIQQKDMEAAKKYSTAGLLTGEAEWFSDGETVFVSDTSIWSNMAKVHRTGETAEYWVLMPSLVE